MALIEAAARGGAVALLALLGALLLRDGRRTAAGRFGGLFAFGVAAYAIASSPAADAIPVAVLVPLRLIALGNPALFWIFASAALDDEFAPTWRQAAAWAGSIALGATCVFGHSGIACLAFPVLSLLFVVLAARMALSGRPADLDEERRRFRVVLVVGSALYTTAIIGAELTLGGSPPGAALATANALGLLAVAFAVALSRLGFAAGPPLAVSEGPGEADAAAPDAPRPSHASAPGPGDPSETLLLAALRRVMEEERAYREEGLAIAGLAARLNVPEYRLRRLINRRLGHRNFSAFVNGYRLAEAEAALADPAEAATPVLTIALDAGFQSIGPFNRAFKLRTGLTPTEYRRQKTGEAGRPA